MGFGRYAADGVKLQKTTKSKTESQAGVESVYPRNAE
jgi:hypothetical protein